MRYIAIIPARYASTRFPAKPLALLGGKPVIQRVYEQVKKVLTDVVVATDDERIYKTVEGFGGRAIMTREDHKSGTDRCYEAYQKVGKEYDVVINVVKPFAQADGLDALRNPNSPKVVVSDDGRAIYFSRSVIPYLRGVGEEEWLSRHTYYKHIGLYAYRAETLGEITRLPQSTLEKVESLEQLRWIDNGYVIKVGETNVETIGIDTPADLERAEHFLRMRK